MSLSKSNGLRLLLRVESGYVVSEIEIYDGHELAGRTLGQSRPDIDGVLVLGVLRADGSYLGAPTRDTAIVAGEVLTVYGLEDDVEQLMRGAVQTSAPSAIA